ncbi:MAG: malectin [Sedimentisphaerales bacterium]
MVKKLVIASCIVTMVVLAFPGCEPTGKTEIKTEAKSKTEAKVSTEAKVKTEAPSKIVLRVNCAATEPYTDKAGNKWLPDQYWEEGKTTWGAMDGMEVDRGELNITGTDAPKIYETERYMMSAYKFKVPNGKYTVRLHFAETYSGITGEGERVFSVTINDKGVLEDFDVYKAAGGPEKPVVKEFKGVTVTNGELAIGFTSNIENPEINGIEILSE